VRRVRPPPQLTGCSRASSRAVHVGCHAPPRGVRMPTLVQFSGDCAVDSDATRSVVLISRLQKHRPVEIVRLAVPVEKRAYLQR
jgi:hypothetical protein